MASLSSFKWYLAIILVISFHCEAYKILFVSPFPSKSHAILGNALVKHLIKAEHEVTYITAMPSDQTESNVTIIDVPDMSHNLQNEMFSVKKIMDGETDFSHMKYFFTIMKELSAIILEHVKVQKLIKDPNQQFDLIIGELMVGELYAGLPAIYQCPFIWFTTTEPTWMTFKIIDELPNPAYFQDTMSRNVLPFTFIQRVKELFYQTSVSMIQHFFITNGDIDNYERIIVPIVREKGNPVPPFIELKQKVSLILGNSHVSLGHAMRLPQNYKPIAGYHIDNNVKPLPQDLQTVMDSAKNGVIYFSLGTMVKSKELPDGIKTGLLKLFGDLKQTVIWKFEENFRDLPKNIHLVHWAPQQSILSHPNCVLFITHGGLLSSTETVHFGVPIIGIPLFGDQFNNIVNAVNKGFAKKVDLSYDLVEDLKEAIDDILSDPKYTRRAKELSLIYHDRPVSPGRELVHWVEHVIRTGGASHLRSPALNVAWYEKMYLDLAAFVFVGIAILIFIFKFVLQLFFSKKLDVKKKIN